MGHLRFKPLEPHPVLFDRAQTGDFAEGVEAEAAKRHEPPWCSWLGWLEDSPVVMGGVTEPGPDGEVEMGYVTFAGFEGRGFATQLAGFLVRTARENGARTIVAHTRSQPNASARVLEKNDFIRDGEAQDEHVGTAWRWRRQL